MEEVNDIASDQEKQSPAFGLKTQGEEIIKGVENSENMLVIGFPGVGKTLLLHSLMKLNSNPHSQWEYHHACNIVVKTTDISNVFDPIIHKFDDNYDNAKLILVIDELDVLTSWKKKNSFEYFHRIALELSKVEKQLVLIGVTNRPHLIGLEFLQLFKTKVYIPLPNKQSRLQILADLLKQIPNDLVQKDMLEIAELTQNFTPCEISVLARSASYHPIKKILKAKSFRKIGEKYVPCLGDEGEIKSFKQIKAQQLFIDKISKTDLLQERKEMKLIYSQQEQLQLLQFLKN